MLAFFMSAGEKNTVTYYHCLSWGQTFC